MNIQEVFNKVATHLIKQNGKSVNAEGLCMYRGLNGLKCAVGCLITDEAYYPQLEGLDCFSNEVQAALEKSSVECYSDMRHMLEDLQDMHDLRGVFYWGDELQEIAMKYGLEVPEINKL